MSNYYNPYYMNTYPYNQYNLPNQQPIPASFQIPQQVTTNQPPQPQGLNGKIVDSEDVVKATEVPIGGYGIFPRADLSEIYIKSWNNNGTTSVITFKPVIPEPVEVQNKGGELSNLLLQKIEILENKLDIFLSQPPIVAEQPKKVEVVKNGF